MPLVEFRVEAHAASGRSKINLQDQLGGREQWRSSSKNRGGALTSIGCLKHQLVSELNQRSPRSSSATSSRRNGCCCSVFPIIQRTTSLILHLRERVI